MANYFNAKKKQMGKRERERGSSKSWRLKNISKYTHTRPAVYAYVCVCKGRTKNMCNVLDRENAAAGCMEIKMQNVCVRYKHTQREALKHMCVCASVCAFAYFIRSRTRRSGKNKANKV